MMANFAKLNENNIVIDVVVVNNDVLMVDGEESESAGIKFLTDTLGHSNWKQTSYNNSFRKRYAGIGFIYNSDMDIFYAPKPYQSWKFNHEIKDWEAPIPMPEGEVGYAWRWFEDSQEWIKIKLGTEN
jgi:hypothetical protein